MMKTKTMRKAMPLFSTMLLALLGATLTLGMDAKAHQVELEKARQAVAELQVWTLELTWSAAWKFHFQPAQGRKCLRNKEKMIEETIRKNGTPSAAALFHIVPSGGYALQETESVKAALGLHEVYCGKAKKAFERLEQATARFLANTSVGPGTGKPGYSQTPFKVGDRLKLKVALKSKIKLAMTRKRGPANSFEKGSTVEVLKVRGLIVDLRDTVTMDTMSYFAQHLKERTESVVHSGPAKAPYSRSDKYAPNYERNYQYHVGDTFCLPKQLKSSNRPYVLRKGMSATVKSVSLAGKLLQLEVEGIGTHTVWAEDCPIQVMKSVGAQMWCRLCGWALASPSATCPRCEK